MVSKKKKREESVPDGGRLLSLACYVGRDDLLHLAGDDGDGVAGDDQLLVGRHDDHLDLTIRGGDDGLGAVDLGIELLVELDAAELHAGADGLAGDGLILSHTAGEDDRIGTTELSEVGSDVLLDALIVHRKGEDAVLVACSHTGLNVAHVARLAGDAEDAGLLIEQVVHLVGGESLLLHNVEDSGRVDVAGAGTHHQPLQRGKSHRGVDALAILDGADGASVADVTGDKTIVVGVKPEDLAGAAADVAVAGAVEAVATDLVLVVEAARDGVHVGLRRHRLVEGGVEDHHLRSLR